MQKDFDAWNEQKKATQERSLNKYVKEREIWWCSLGVNIGDEEDGKNTYFERPVLILKKFNTRLVLVVPLSTKAKQNPYYFNFVRGGIPYGAIISQTRPISTKRLNNCKGKLDTKTFSELKERIRSSLL